MNQITDRLWISDISTVRQQSVPTDAVVTVCQDSVEDNVGCYYHHFNMADGEIDIYGGDCSYELFEEAVDTVVWHVESGRSVLVHCHAGMSRSAAVCIAVVGAVEEMHYADAYDTVAEARPMIDPNAVLVGHVHEYLGTWSDLGA